MSSITRTNIGKTQTQQKAEPAKATKPAASPRKRSSGGFIAVDNLIDGNKK